MIRTEFFSSKNPEETFRFIASGDAMELFVGGFLLPGIQEATISGGGRRISVRDSWGLRHEERVVSYKKPTSLVFHIKPNPLLGMLIKSLAEEWQIEGISRGSLVRRTFSFIPRLWAAPFLLLIEKVVQRAIKKNNTTLSFYLLLRREELKKPLNL